MIEEYGTSSLSHPPLLLALHKSEEGSMAERKENIVMFPFMAQGHIIPFLALALQIEQRQGYSITFVNTPLNIKKLRSSLPPNSSIRLLEIPFCSSDHGLPPHIENTDVLPSHLIVQLITASSSLKPSFTKLISGLVQEQHGHAPLCIIADIFLGWTVDIAHEFGMFHVILSVSPGFGLACYYSLWSHLPHKKTDSDEFLLPEFPEAGKIHVTQLVASLSAADGMDSYSVFHRRNFPTWFSSDGFLFNSVEELDHMGLLYFRKKFGRPVWPIGPILLSADTRASAGITSELCNQWLDSKPVNSVLYISFGSQNTISALHMRELAMALEATGKNFIWVVRPPLGFDINSEFKDEEWLPEGFKQRNENQNRGLLVHKWAPQAEILSHKSVSAFLTQCGWNSVLEALSHGVPLLGWLMAAEQFYTAKLLEEQIGVCVEVGRGSNLEVRHEDIEEKIEVVMNESAEKGKEMRKKACEVREMIKDAVRDEDGFMGSSVKAMDDFLNAALLLREKTKMVADCV